MFLIFLANSDIYFDNTLLRLKNAAQLQLRQHLFALLKWVDIGDNLYLPLRTDSQDAWIFQPPVRDSVVESSDFPMGVPKCDNRLAYLFGANNYTVTNPAFSIHAIEIQSKQRVGSLYGTKGAPFGETADILLSDSFSLPH